MTTDRLTAAIYGELAPPAHTCELGHPLERNNHPGNGRPVLVHTFAAELVEHAPDEVDTAADVFRALDAEARARSMADHPSNGVRQP